MKRQTCTFGELAVGAWFQFPGETFQHVRYQKRDEIWAVLGGDIGQRMRPEMLVELLIDQEAS